MTGKTATVDAKTGAMILSEPKPERLAKASAFEGAKLNRFTSDWITSNASMDCLLEPSLIRLRSRSSDLVRNDGYAYNAEEQVLSNVIGPEGFKIKVNAKTAAGRAMDKKASEAVRQAWKEFCQAENYTVTGDVTEHGFDCLLLRSVFRKGGGLARMAKGFRDNGWRFAMQGIAIDRLDPEYSFPNKNISMSVEYDGFGREIGYHILDQNPGDRYYGGPLPGKRSFLGSGDAIHAYVKEEFGQSQGKPWLTPVIARLRQLHGYEEAELIAARAHASKLGFFETDFNSPAGGYQGEGQDSLGNITMDGSPGSFENLPPGVKATLIDPTHPNANYPDFRKGMLRGIASGIITNYNILGNDLEGVNYSSIRSGTLSERDRWMIIQRWWIDTVKKPIFSQWLQFALMAGKIPGYGMADFERLNHAEFTGRRWAWVDPDKDSKAEERRLKNRLTSHQEICRQHGKDHDEVLQQVAEDEKKAEQMQLDLFLDIQEPQTVEAEVTNE